MKTRLISIIFLLVFYKLNAQQLPSPFKIIPQPQKIILAKNEGLWPQALKQIHVATDFKMPLVGLNLSKLPITKSSAPGSINFIIDQNNAKIPNEEAYIMTINSSQVDIRAKSNAGFFYACQSLEQLIEDSNTYKKSIPACEIIDYPVLNYRAVHFDVKHHLDRMEYYYQSIDRLARYKINAVVFEFEDKLGYQKQPKVASPQAISIDEMAKLTNYARVRNIEITPLVQGLGHASFILKHDHYEELRELKYNTWAFCPKDERTYQVLFDLYADAIKATPGSKYLHIGGDEIGNIGLCPRCKPTADKEGMMSLNLNWLKRVCAFAKENNRIPIFWDDMPFQHAGLFESTYSDDISEAKAKELWQKGTPALDSLLNDFPKNCVYMRWNYTMARQPGNILALDWYKKNGLKTMIATATNSEGNMFFQKDDRGNEPNSGGIIAEKSFIELAADKNVSGMLCTAWDDKSPHMENYWYGFIAAAEYSWSPKNRSLEQYEAAWLQKEFGLIEPRYKAFHDKLTTGSSLYYEAYYNSGNMFDGHNNLQSLKQVEHWLEPKEGTELVKFDYSSKLIDLPDSKNIGAWSQKHKVILDKAQMEANNFPAILQKLQNLEKASTRNKYYWQLSKALYQLQYTTPVLLLALKQADSPAISEQKTGKIAVTKALQDFQETWDNLVTVYSKTRFVSNPANYVPDRYFHYASQKEDLTWMIQAQEIYHEKIKDWLK